jgi:hypothetical protein
MTCFFVNMCFEVVLLSCKRATLFPPLSGGRRAIQRARDFHPSKVNDRPRCLCMFPASQNPGSLNGSRQISSSSLRRTHRSKRVAFEAMELYTLFDNMTGTLPVAERPKCYKDEAISPSWEAYQVPFPSFWNISSILHSSSLSWLSSHLLLVCHTCSYEVPHSLFIRQFLAPSQEISLHYNLMDLL